MLRCCLFSSPFSLFLGCFFCSSCSPRIVSNIYFVIWKIIKSQFKIPNTKPLCWGCSRQKGHRVAFSVEFRATSLGEKKIMKTPTTFYFIFNFSRFEAEPVIMIHRREPLRGEPKLSVWALERAWLPRDTSPASQAALLASHCSMVTVLPPWQRPPILPKQQVLVKNSLPCGWEPWEGNLSLRRWGEGRSPSIWPFPLWLTCPTEESGETMLSRAVSFAWPKCNKLY